MKYERNLEKSPTLNRLEMISSFLKQNIKSESTFGSTSRQLNVLTRRVNGIVRYQYLELCKLGFKKANSVQFISTIRDLKLLQTLIIKLIARYFRA